MFSLSQKRIKGAIADPVGIAIKRRIQQVQDQLLDGTPEHRRECQQCTESRGTLACTESVSEHSFALRGQ
jgi:hypothetical protein